MLDSTYFNNILIDSYKQEILKTFMSEFCIFIKISLNLLYLVLHTGTEIAEHIQNIITSAQ